MSSALREKQKNLASYKADTCSLAFDPQLIIKTDSTNAKQFCFMWMWTIRRTTYQLVYLLCRWPSKAGTVDSFGCSVFIFQYILLVYYSSEGSPSQIYLFTSWITTNTKIMHALLEQSMFITSSIEFWQKLAYKSICLVLFACKFNPWLKRLKRKSL